MLILFENYFKPSKKEILLSCAPNRETQVAIQHLSEQDIEQFFTDAINENVFTWIKDKLDNLGDSVKKIATKAFNSLGAFIQTIKNSIGDAISKAYDVYSKMVTQPLDAKKEEILEKMTNILKNEDPKKIKIEISGLKDSLTYVAKYFTGGISQDLTKAANQVAKDDVSESIFQTLSENPEMWSVILEGDHAESIPFVSKIAHKLGEYPPFSILHKIQHGIQHFSNSVLTKVSEFAEMIGGPKAIKFEIVGALVGLVGEYAIKNLAVSGIAEIGKFASNVLSSALLSALPFVTIILKTIKYTALGLWIVSLAETIIKAFK